MPDIYVQLEVNSQNLWSRYDDHFMSIAWQGVQAHSFMYHGQVTKLLAAYISVARFTKYLTTILRLSYDNAKVTIDLR